MSTNPRFPETREEISKELTRIDLDASPSTVDALATVGAGYLELQDGSLGPLFPSIPAHRAAASLVAIYRQGIRPTPPTKGIYGERFREIVDMALAQRQMHWLDHQARSTLAALALGAWDETDLPGKRKPIGEYFVTLFSNGLD